MQFKFGDHSHDANEANLASYAVEHVYSDSLKHVMERRTMTIEGFLLPDSATQASIKTKIQTLETGYEDPVLTSGVAGLFHDDGTTQSAHIFDASESIAGIRVLDFQYPRGNPGEYATRRFFRITMQADFKVGGDKILFYRDSFRRIGDGQPRTVMVETLTGFPQRQQVNQRTIVRGIQQGEAVGRDSHPNFPSPVYPSPIFKPDLAEQETIGPREMGNGFIEYPIRWVYPFESSNFLVPAVTLGS